MLQRKSAWVGLGLLLTLSAFTMLGEWISSAHANVTLVSFTATSLNGQPEVFVKWETATEIAIAGFYVQRSLTGQANSYTNVSPFQPAQGDSVTGALYDWLDDTTTLNTPYYYRLEEIPSDASHVPIVYAPVWVVAGLASTPTPTPPVLIYLPIVFRSK